MTSKAVRFINSIFQLSANYLFVDAFQIRAHQNAILDLAWSFDDQFIVIE